MNWEAIGAVGEILGAVAVIATLMYLARQLNQSMASSHSAATDRIIRTFDEINRMLTTNGTLRETLLKETELTPSEREQYFQFVVLYCNVWWSAQLEFDRGQIPEELYLGAAQDVQVEIDRWPKFKEYGQLWLERYPEVGAATIFDPLRKHSG